LHSLLGFEHESERKTSKRETKIKMEQQVRKDVTQREGHGEKLRRRNCKKQ
jgi:hypothetical protein